MFCSAMPRTYLIHEPSEFCHLRDTVSAADPAGSGYIHTAHFNPTLFGLQIVLWLAAIDLPLLGHAPELLYRNFYQNYILCRRIGA